MARSLVDAIATFASSATTETLNRLQNWLPAPQIGPQYGHMEAYVAGEVVGSVAGMAAQVAIVSVATGGLGGLASCGSLLQRAAYTYNVVQSLSGLVSSAQNIASGQGTWMDGLTFVASAAGLLMPTNCFVAGTRVLTQAAAGASTPFSTRPIEDIQIGDEVLTRDPNDPDGALATSRVTQVFRHVATDLQRVSITDADGNVETYDVTDEHPFYVQGQGWVAAADLVSGEQVQGEDGVWETVTENLDDKRPEGIVVYNFEVERSHTYFVEDGLGEERFGVWVHNACTAATRNGIKKHNEYSKIWDAAGYITNKASIPGTRLRPDAMWILYNAVGDVSQVIIRELKPNNARAIARGIAQVNNYAAKLRNLKDFKDCPIRLIVEIYR